MARERDYAAEYERRLALAAERGIDTSTAEGRQRAAGHRGAAAYDRLLGNARHVDIFRGNDGRIVAGIEDRKGAVRYVTLRSAADAARSTKRGRDREYQNWKRNAQRKAPDVTIYEYPVKRK